MSHLSVPISRPSGSEPKPLSTPSSEGKGPLGLGNVVVLDNWQSYIFLGAMLILTMQTAQKFFKGEFTGGLTHSGLLATTVMGKIYTDDSLAKFSLGQIARSMETHVGHLEHEVDTFTRQLEENQQHISRLGHENEAFYHNNAEYRGQIGEMRRVLGEYYEHLTETVQEATEARERILEEIREANEEKKDLKEHISERQKALLEIEQRALEIQQKAVAAQRRLEQASQHILELAEQASKNAHDPLALREYVERIRTNPSSPFGCGTPLPYSPFNRDSTEVY